VSLLIEGISMRIRKAARAVVCQLTPQSITERSRIGNEPGDVDQFLPIRGESAQLNSLMEAFFAGLIRGEIKYVLRPGTWLCRRLRGTRRRRKRNVGACFSPG
jgi:hypothetical protein